MTRPEMIRQIEAAIDALPGAHGVRARLRAVLHQLVEDEERANCTAMYELGHQGPVGFRLGPVSPLGREEPT